MPTKISLYLGKVIKENAQLSELDRINRKFLLKLDGCLLVSGDPGTGKTVLAKAVAEECVLNHVPTLIIDPKGNLSQISWPLDMGLYFGQSKKDGEMWRSLLRSFGIEGLVERYAELLEVRLLDQCYSPSKADIVSIFSGKESKSTQVTVVVPCSDNEKENHKAIENWLSAIQNALKELSLTKNEKMLIVDEAHRFTKKGSPAYESLDTILRENRNSRLRVMLCTQRFSDIKDLAHHIKYRCDFAKKRRCVVSYRPNPKAGFVQAHDYGTHVSPRGLLTVDRTEAMTAENFGKTRDLWDARRHPWTPLFKPSPELRDQGFNATDVAILNFLNCQPVTMNWNSAKTQMGKLGISKSAVERLLSNKELRNLAHYHAILDYEKLGYSILAFFICKGKDPESGRYRKGIQNIVNWTNTLDLYEISSPKYVDVNLLAKFRFKDMDEYYMQVESELLKISKRGKSEKERYRMFLEKLLEEIPKRVKELKDLPLMLEKDFPVQIPTEQIVSGCIKTRTFSEYHSCYLEEGTFKTLNRKEHQALRKVIEIRYPKCKVDLDAVQILDRMRELNLLPAEFTKEELRERIHVMTQKGIINGTYLGIPWGMLGYKTKFIVGQLNFDRLEELAHIIGAHHKVQEVHTIVGTYDVIVKVRFKEKGELDEVLKHIDQCIARDELIELDVEKELKTKFRMIRLF